jgi:hypothetical protein
MFVFQAIKQFQSGLRGRNFVRFRTAFGANFVRWFDIIRRVLFVAKRLTKPYWIGKRLQNTKTKCFRLLSEFRWSQNDWNIRELLQSLEQFDPELSQLFLQIVEKVLRTSSFLEYIQCSRRFLQEGERQDLNPDRRSPYPNVTTFVTLRVIDSLVEVASANPVLVG